MPRAEAVYTQAPYRARFLEPTPSQRCPVTCALTFMAHPATAAARAERVPALLYGCDVIGHQPGCTAGSRQVWWMVWVLARVAGSGLHALSPRLVFWCVVEAVVLPPRRLAATDCRTWPGAAALVVFPPLEASISHVGSPWSLPMTALFYDRCGWSSARPLRAAAATNRIERLALSVK